MIHYGLALAGGGARGAAHVGVLMALEEEKLLPEQISGTSAGSIVGGLYASGMSSSELKEVILWMQEEGRWFLDTDFMGILTLFFQIAMKRDVCLSGLFKGKRLEKYLHELTGGIGIEEAGCGILIPAVDIRSGNTIVYTNLFHDRIPASVKLNESHVIWETNGKLSEIIMASSSIPAIFRPRQIGGRLLVDGGITNNLPVDLLIAAGVPYVIAVDIGADYESPPDECMMEVLSSSFELMRRELKDCRSSGEILLLKPKLPKDAGLLSFHCMEECVEAGYSYTKKKASQIRRILTSWENSEKK